MPNTTDSSQDISDNRYATDWDRYSQEWNKNYGRQYQHLGDEWCDDGSAERQRENLTFSLMAEPYIKPGSTVVEIGPGGGKWTVRLAPLVKKLLVFDVSHEMLKRTQNRLAAKQIENAEFILGNGTDMHQIDNQSVDYIFSFDVFVHIAMQDLYAYLKEFYRILKPGAHGAVHHAIASTPYAWNRAEKSNEYLRKTESTLGQYYYYPEENLSQLYESCGLIIDQQFFEYCFCTIFFHKAKTFDTLKNVAPVKDSVIIHGLNKSLSECESQIAVLKQQNRKAIMENGQLLSLYKQLEETNGELTQKNTELAEKISKKNNELSNAQNTITNYENKLSDARNVITNYENELSRIADETFRQRWKRLWFGSNLKKESEYNR